MTEAVSRALVDGIAQARQGGATAHPVLACLMNEQGSRSQLDLGNEQIPCFPFPEEAARTLCKMANYADWRRQPPGVMPDFDDLDLPYAQHVCQTALAERGSGWLSVAEIRKVLTAMHLPLLPGDVAHSADAAVELARRIGFPVAAKLASRQVIHKTEIGGVHLNLTDDGAVRRAFDQIHNRLERDHQLAAMEGVLVQPMITGGTEVIVGVTHGPLFGPLVAFGLGGIHVEILGDICVRVTPLTDRDAREMVRAIRGYRLFQGYRGHPPADVEAVEEVLLRISRLVEEVPEISELDLNPIMALPPGVGCRIVDARIRVGHTP
jgi:acyl-CoA synthetase (NDP forming)